MFGIVVKRIFTARHQVQMSSARSAPTTLRTPASRRHDRITASLSNHYNFNSCWRLLRLDRIGRRRAVAVVVGPIQPLPALTPTLSQRERV